MQVERIQLPLSAIVTSPNSGLGERITREGIASADPDPDRGGQSQYHGQKRRKIDAQSLLEPEGASPIEKCEEDPRGKVIDITA